MKAAFVSSLAGLVSLVNAAVQFDNSDYSGITAGSDFEITWSGNDGPVTIWLKDGESTDLNTVMTLNSGIEGSSWVWPVSPSTVDGMYALQINDTSSTNYSPQFEITGGMSTSSSMSSSMSSTTSSSMTSSSSMPASSSSMTITTTSSTSATTSMSSSASTTPTSSSSSQTSSTTTSAAPSSTTAPPDTTGGDGAAAGLAVPVVAPFVAALVAALF